MPSRALKRHEESRRSGSEVSAIPRSCEQAVNIHSLTHMSHSTVSMTKPPKSHRARYQSQQLPSGNGFVLGQAHCANLIAVNSSTNSDACISFTCFCNGLWRNGGNMTVIGAGGSSIFVGEGRSGFTR